MNENISQIYQKRVKAFFVRLSEYFFAETKPLTMMFCNSGAEIIPYESRQQGDFHAIAEGEIWGKSWDSAWFHLTGQVPAEWQGQKVVLYLNFGGEALIFDADGVPYYALSVSSIFDRHFRKEFFPFADKAQGGEKIDYWVETSANQLFGMYMNESPALDEPFPHGTITPVINHARMGIFRSDVWHLQLDFEVLLGLTETLSNDDYRKNRIFATLNEAIAIFGDNPDHAKAARTVLKKVMLPAMASSMSVTAVGHAHIDTGWLWRVRESKRKCARTYANQIYNIEHYPDYIFGASQAQHYQFVKDNYPKLYEKVKKAIHDGRWEVQGGMWVECDCNLTSGESLIRQFLHGKNFFRDEFGIDVRNVWIPDVFGYSASMPQICRLAGCDFFLTQKISWNQINRFPYNTFVWEGIDGSTLLTHFPPENTYLTELNPAQLVPAQNRYSENIISNEFISLFGIGDGGGGPKQEYIERGIRCANLEGVPRVHFGKAQDAFDQMKKLEPQLEHWSGELYLELHRGTYTTQARVKKRNRQLEQLLTATELYLSGRQSRQTNAESNMLDKAWKTLLINQFHDILPGSAITEVYQDTHHDFDEIEATCRQLLEQETSSNTLTLCNTLSIPWRGVLAIPGWQNARVISGGEMLASEPITDALEVRLHLKAMSTLVLQKDAPSTAPKSWTECTHPVLENALVRYDFAENGELIRAYDKLQKRELLNDNQRGNVYSLFVDRPAQYEAWDHDIYYREGFLEHARAVQKPLEWSGTTADKLRFTLKIGNSDLRVTATLCPDDAMLSFHTEAEWHENRRMLRVAFASDVHAQEAICDIQYGYARRATHTNTSWEQAKFEVPVHRYMDLRDAKNAFALINDCKYGMALAPDTLDLMLLRSTKYPDWTADQGPHSFGYTWLPHRMDDSAMMVIDRSAAFNRSPLMLPGVRNWRLPVYLTSNNIRLEVVKRAEKSDDLILRVVESAGAISEGILTIAPDWTLHDCDLLEWNAPGPEIQLANRQTTISMHPFEIRTYRLCCNKENEKEGYLGTVKK